MGREAWQSTNLGAIRGITLGPIESALHPDKGYGTDTCASALREVRRLGANWVSVTPFGRVWDLHPSGVSLTFEKAFEENRLAVARTVAQAHGEGLRVLLVPHLWVESGEWRALIDPGDDEGWQRWQAGYRAFLLTWAEVAEQSGVDMLSVGVELRSWLTTTRAGTFVEILRDVRGVYSGLLTYAANWDDVEQTVILGELDVIGLNAFFPLAERENATLEELMAGGQRVAARVHQLAHDWDKPVMFTEFGYTTRADPALRPWEWPDHMKSVRVDELAQADAYRGLLSALLEEPAFAGLFAWRLYADPNDMSQEAEWGFSPRGKLAEPVLRDAFSAHWAGDGPREPGASLDRHTARRAGVF